MKDNQICEMAVDYKHLHRTWAITCETKVDGEKKRYELQRAISKLTKTNHDLHKSQYEVHLKGVHGPLLIAQGKHFIKADKDFALFDQIGEPAVHVHRNVPESAKTEGFGHDAYAIAIVPGMDVALAFCIS